VVLGFAGWFLFFLCWRRLLALLAAFWLSDHFFQVAVLGTKSHYHPRNVPVLLFLVLAAVSYFLWMTSLYAAIRYGYFDKTTQMIVRWSAIMGTIFVSWDHPIVVSLFIALCGLQAFLSMAKPEGRRQFLVVATTVGSGFISYLLILLVIRFAFSAVSSTTGPGSLVLGHSSISWIKFPLSFIAAWATTSVYSRMRSWILQWNEPKTTNGPDLA